MGAYDCEPDPTTPDPPPTDPNGNGGGGNNDGTGTGTGTGTDPGTGTGGTQEPTQCGSLACDATLQAMSAQLISILGAVNTTRSNELAGILSAAKTANGNGLSTLIKVGTIAADVFEAVSYLSNIYSKLGQSQIDLSAMRDSLSTVKDLMSQMNGKFDVQKQQIDDMLSKLDQQLGKQEAANGKLDDIKDKLDDLRQKGQDGNDKLDDLRRKHDDTNGKLDDIKGKLDRGNSTWDAILEWVTRLSVLSDILDWLKGFSIDLTPITNLLDAILNKLDFCADHPDWLFCPSDLPDVDAVDLDTKPIDADFSPRVTGSGSCPADVPIALSFGTYSLSFAYICDLADSLYYLVLALSYLAAARILAAPLGVG
ncbi:hypothetical protein CEK71_21540 [Methylovulum psychrotolerans]|uniref:t-SNARE coiled-coil homology domain-containing protein n=1 Tax=Methylovulum psychrotolerans TaxID=1704499 RepID=A0A1Z4C4G2_9GAMM|nr:hypothetical protein CEK71_21540 [Methylovulum psychrotolerans]